MKIVFFETAEWEHGDCLLLEPEHEVACTPQRLSAGTAAGFDDADAVSTFVKSDLGAAVLEKLPRLRFIATRSTGFDHIDLEHCRQRGITVSNVPDYGDSTVAEHVFALLLAVSRNLVENVESTRRGNFTQGGKPGFELRGKTLGVVGTGRIGRRVIEIAGGFGMHVIAHDLHPDQASAAALGFRYADLPSLLAEADVVTLHVPATASSANLISDNEFSAMKSGAVLINTARGNIVDVAALVRALNDGRLHAAGLDVLPSETLIREEAQIFRGPMPAEPDLQALLANHALLHFPNVIVTPHNAYNTMDALRRIIATTLANVRAFARGEPENVVS